MNPLRNSLIMMAAFTAAAAAQAPHYILHGTDPEGRFGFVVRGIGDANGDGLPDFAVGAPYTDANGIVDSGMLRTYSGATGLRLREYRGNSQYEGSGFALAGAGDVDGDGKADLLWSDIDARLRYPGSFTVASGATGRLLLRVHGDTGYEYLGHDVCAAGDVDADGYGDYVASEPGNDDGGNHAGRVRVFSGRTKLPIRTFLGSGPNEDFGCSLSCAGDIDGDGIIDLVIGAPRADLPGRVDCGMVRVFSGRTGAVLFTWHGDAAEERLGCSVTGNGDVNGDGVPDLVAGALRTGVDAVGHVKVFSGRDGSLLQTWIGPNEGGLFGYALGLADVDGNGFDNVIIGAPEAAGAAGPQAGQVWVEPDAMGNEPWRFEGPTMGAHFGFSVDGADIDGDGYVDLVVGAPDATVQGVEVGAAYVFRFVETGTPPMVAYRGAGCRGADRLLPRIDIFGRPQLGGSYEAYLRGARPSTAAALNLGSAWDQSLAPWAPDCIVYAMPDASLTVTTSSEGTAMVEPFPMIPRDPALIGVRLHHQWIVVDPGAPNALGIAVSNDAIVRLGM